MNKNKPGNTDAKAYIQRYFSDELQYDESPGGAMERWRLQKWLLEWASDYTVPQTENNVADQ